KVATDPMMGSASPAGASAGKSFSDLDELPPMKEPVYTPPPPPPPIFETAEPSALSQLRRKEEKPKIQPREVADKALKEIKTVPPQLMIYSILGAVALILIVAVAVYFHVRSEDEDATAAPRPSKPVITQQASPTQAAPTNPAPQNIAPEPEPEPEVTVRQVEKHAARKKVPAPAPVAKV